MGIKLREHWFGILLATLVLICLLFVGLIAFAPHNDQQMRGFTPCTFEMGVKLNQAGEARELGEVMKAITNGYICYATVIGTGVKLWVKGEQATPWANYLFAADVFEIPAGESEPFSEDLLKANQLDDDEGENLWLYQNQIRENDNGEE